MELNKFEQRTKFVQTEARLTDIHWILYKARNVWDVF